MNRRFIIIIMVFLAVLAGDIIFKIIITPPLENMGKYSLNLSNLIEVENAFRESPSNLLFPVEVKREQKWYYWAPSSSFPLFASFRLLPPLQAYILASSILITAVFYCSLFTTRSLLFAITLCVMVSFGPQFYYCLSYGSSIQIYYILTYCTLNLFFGIKVLRGQEKAIHNRLFYCGTLVLLGFSSEWWLNYGVSLLVGCFALWFFTEKREQKYFKRSDIYFIVISVLMVLFVYLVAKSSFAKYYLAPGVEDELWLTYNNILFPFEDFVINLFTFLYMASTAYLPFSITLSNSLVFKGPEEIIAAQNGYHAAKNNLIVMSHLFYWRFYAGMVVVFYFILIKKRFYDAYISTIQNENSIMVSLIKFVLSVMALAGLATHLMIKIRPYNSAPVLYYKVSLSIFILSILASYCLMVVLKKRTRKQGVIITIIFYGCILISYLFNPYAINAHLNLLGLVGYGDPLKINLH